MSEAEKVLARADATLERMRRFDAAVGVNDAVARAVAKERAAVVAYLKSLADASGKADAFWQGVASGNGYAAQMIERGEHRREEEP